MISDKRIINLLENILLFEHIIIGLPEDFYNDLNESLELMIDNEIVEMKVAIMPTTYQLELMGDEVDSLLYAWYLWVSDEGQFSIIVVVGDFELQSEKLDIE